MPPQHFELQMKPALTVPIYLRFKKCDALAKHFLFNTLIKV